MRNIGPAGTAARIGVGLGMIGLAMPGGVSWTSIVLGLGVIPAVLLAWQLIRLKIDPAPLRETGSLGVCLNAAVAAVLLIWSATHDAALLWLGASMLLAAWRGYAGCETLAISNWLLRRDDQVGCVLFFPIDELEAKRTARMTSGG